MTSSRVSPFLIFQAPRFSNISPIISPSPARYFTLMGDASILQARLRNGWKQPEFGQFVGRPVDRESLSYLLYLVITCYNIRMISITCYNYYEIIYIFIYIFNYIYIIWYLENLWLQCDVTTMMIRIQGIVPIAGLLYFSYSQAKQKCHSSARMIPSGKLT
jgi:hypothetical protein